MLSSYCLLLCWNSFILVKVYAIIFKTFIRSGKLKKYFITVLFVLFPLLSHSNNSIVGYWKTIDDATNEVKSIVKIYKTDNGLFAGEIVKIFPKPGEDPEPVCDKCTENFKNKPIIGLKFMWNFKQEKGKWVDGKILDPDNGKIYHCSLSLIENGEKLEVYGYIKIIFKIGRKQIWLKTEKP